MKTKTRGFRPQIRSKNHSIAPLRTKQEAFGKFPVRSVVRFGSRTTTAEVFKKSPAGVKIIEINTVEAVECSRNKLKMKAAFDKAGVTQAQYFLTVEDVLTAIKKEQTSFPIVAKRITGQKARGMTLCKNEAELKKFSGNTDYFFEKFYNFAKEYRLHVSDFGVFLGWRKLRRQGEEVRWYFNNDNCNWVNENHELFRKPSNWKILCDEAKKALQAVGLNIGACDIRIQSKEQNPAFIICEVNSAPALGTVGVDAYKAEITKLIDLKCSNKH